MPSPFPGMDPYLEDPRLWPDVHARLVPMIADSLMALVRPAYFVQVEERVYLSNWNDPGVRVYVSDVQVAPTERLPVHAGGGTAVIDEPIILADAEAMEVREPYLKLKDARSCEVITVIELLSPSNKTSGALSRKLYLEMRDAIRATKTQFVEIDLLRGGQRLPWVGPLPQSEYLALASVTSGKPRTKVWPMKLTERLKTIGIPLKAGEPDAPLDLQAALNTVYDRAGYDLVIDYTQPPDPPLTPEQAKWSAEWLSRTHGNVRES
jgi:hypothetical protein